ncbi:MAG TPA: hypothetical protein PK878_05080 [bacterium]|nr:hypothetical protein [bacterium]HXK92587.1 hypothetical protein [bacterium]
MLPPNLLLDAVSAESLVVQATRTQRPDHLTQQEIQNHFLYLQQEEFRQAGILPLGYVPPTHPLTLQSERSYERPIFTILPFYLKSSRTPERRRKPAGDIMPPSRLEIERDKGAVGYSIHNQSRDVGQFVDLIA